MTRTPLISLISILLTTPLSAQVGGSAAQSVVRRGIAAVDASMLRPSSAVLRLGATGTQEARTVQEERQSLILRHQRQGGLPRPQRTRLWTQQPWGPSTREANSPWQEQTRAYHTESGEAEHGPRETKNELKEETLPNEQRAIVERLLEILRDTWGYEPNVEIPTDGNYAYIANDPSENEPWLQEQFQRLFGILFISGDDTHGQLEEQFNNPDALDLYKLLLSCCNEGTTETNIIAHIVAGLVKLERRYRYRTLQGPITTSDPEGGHSHTIGNIYAIIQSLDIDKENEPRACNVETFIQKLLVARAHFISLPWLGERVRNRCLHNLSIKLDRIRDEREAWKNESESTPEPTRSLKEMDIDHILYGYAFEVIQSHITAQRYFAALHHPEMAPEGPATLQQIEKALEAVLSHLRFIEEEELAYKM